MTFGDLLATVGKEPLFETGLLLSGNRDARDVRRQLSRWVAQGRLHRLRRGLYAIAPPFDHQDPHPFLIANLLVRGSYVSLQSALAHHGVIPEHVPVTTSVTTGRPGHWETAFGRFEYRHLHKDIFGDYRREPLGGGRHAFVATPAKALGDLVHLVPGADSREYIDGLRVDAERVGDLAAEAPRLAARPKVRRAFARLASIASASEP